MPVSDRRAPYKARKFTVLETFRYERRIYEKGTTWVPRGNVPRHRLDRLWRDGKIGTLDGDSCTAVKAEPVEPPTEAQLKALESMAAANSSSESKDDEDESEDDESEGEESESEDDEDESEDDEEKDE